MVILFQKNLGLLSLTIDLSRQEIHFITNLAIITNYIIALSYDIIQKIFLIYLLLLDYSKELTFLSFLIYYLPEFCIFLVFAIGFL